VRLVGDPRFAAAHLTRGPHRPVGNADHARPSGPRASPYLRLRITRRPTSATTGWDVTSGARCRGTRRDVIKLARKGQPYPDRKAAIKGLGWAWAVLGPPDSRIVVSGWKRLAFALDVVTSGSNGRMDILDGTARYDHYPWVRHVARQVERANANLG
jgi:hypothetical protein